MDLRAEDIGALFGGRRGDDTGCRDDLMIVKVRAFLSLSVWSQLRKEHAPLMRSATWCRLPECKRSEDESRRNVCIRPQAEQGSSH